MLRQIRLGHFATAPGSVTIALTTVNSISCDVSDTCRLARTDRTRQAYYTWRADDIPTYRGTWRRLNRRDCR